MVCLFRILKDVSLYVLLLFFIGGLTIFSNHRITHGANDNKTSYISGPMGKNVKIVFLHRSTGNMVWRAGVPGYIKKYNRKNGTNYQIYEKFFPKGKGSPYGSRNAPYDYWNIWVNHAGPEAYMEEPTLEILTQKYDIIIFKHCFPVSDIREDTGRPNINSQSRRAENYKLHYGGLKEKMRKFTNNRFILWTGAALNQSVTTPEKATRAKAFFDWVRTEWDEPGDNIYLWDFYELQTEGGLYLKAQYAKRPRDPHPSKGFSRKVAPFFSKRIVDVIEGRGDSSSITGK